MNIVGSDFKNCVKGTRYKTRFHRWINESTWARDAIALIVGALCAIGGLVIYLIRHR
jgi:hypothetical protein